MLRNREQITSNIFPHDATMVSGDACAQQGHAKVPTRYGLRVWDVSRVYDTYYSICDGYYFNRLFRCCTVSMAAISVHHVGPAIIHHMPTCAHRSHIIENIYTLPDHINISDTSSPLAGYLLWIFMCIIQRIFLRAVRFRLDICPIVARTPKCGWWMESDINQHSFESRLNSIHKSSTYYT